MDLRLVDAKGILSKCGIPGIDYVINPYTGCRFGCTYCYASFMGRFIKDKEVKDWGEYVFVKQNAPQLLKKELKSKLKNKGMDKEILLSSVTDPYQGVEAKYKLTRQCLQELLEFGFEGYLSILTKSDLVTRDIDLLKKFKNVAVGLTVTSTDDSISKYFEKFAPSVSKRFSALEKLNKEGIRTYAFIGPLLPHYVSYSGELEKLFKKLNKIGTNDIFVEHLNLSKYIKDRLIQEMKDEQPEIISKFYESQAKDYRESLNELVEKLVKKYNMNLLTGNVIFHKEFQKQQKLREKIWK